MGQIGGETLTEISSGSIGLAGKEADLERSAIKYGSLAPIIAEFITLGLIVLTRIPDEFSIFLVYYQHNSPEVPKKSANAREKAVTAAFPGAYPKILDDG